MEDLLKNLALGITADTTVMSIPGLLWHESLYERSISLYTTFINNDKKRLQELLRDRSEVLSMTDEEILTKVNATVSENIVFWRNRLNLKKSQQEELGALSTSLFKNACHPSVSALFNRVYDQLGYAIETTSHMASKAPPPILSPDEWRDQRLQHIDRMMVVCKFEIENNTKALIQIVRNAWELNKVCPKPGGYNLPHPDSVGVL